MMETMTATRSTPGPCPRGAGTRWARRAMLLLAMVLAGGCFRSGPCRDVEECNGRDDDCDGATDEGFVDAETGLYRTVDDCGGCGVACADVFPSAAATRCVVEPRGIDPDAGDDDDDGDPLPPPDPDALVARCQIVACPPGTRLLTDAGCVPVAPTLCLPCTDDDDCALREPGSRCAAALGGEPRCFPSCEGGCPAGTRCADLPDDGDPLGARACLPLGGDCTCNDATLGAVFGCRVTGGGGRRCDGVQTCEVGGRLSACVPALDEVCNGADDDCDGAVDETFRDGSGRYVLDPVHCGGCNAPCAEPGPNTTARCVPDGASARCEVDCEDGFVDVDGIEANGCECERLDGDGPPPAVGGDADCDGVPDDDDDFVHVTPAGRDGNPGTLLRPVRTIQRGIAIGAAEGKAVLVARGVYAGPVVLRAGVSVFGGYRPDFRDRDLALFPVRIERGSASPGEPVLVARGIRRGTTVDGITVAGSDGVTPGDGSTAVYLSGSTSALVLSNVTVFAGRGADGRRGEDSSDRLGELGFDDLDELDGPGGGDGLDAGFGCPTLDGGRGGRQRCGGRAVSGGDGGDATCPDLGCRNGTPCGNSGCTDFTDDDGVCDVDAMLAAAVPHLPAVEGRGSEPGSPGERTYASPTNRGTCNFCDDNPTLRRLGGDGGDGGEGDPGVGGEGCPPGIAGLLVDVDRGLLGGLPGTDGTGGTDGAGGGGGTPGAGYGVIGNTLGSCTDRNGGSGGGGGAGGCGAPGAGGGGGGGASVGILVRLADGSRTGPRLEDVRIVTGSGGLGGGGGIGASGGAGGSGGVGGAASFFCARNGGNGGDGGDGGAGGGGGGGCGGASHGVFVLRNGADGVDPYLTDLTAGTDIEALGVAGRGGAGGSSPSAPGTGGARGDARGVGSD